MIGGPLTLDHTPTDDAGPRLIPPVRPVRRRLLTAEVADTIREMILTGQLEPGSRFTQQELARALGVSTMPVREALLRLTHDGLIAASPNRSYRVERMTRADIQDIYWMHSMLAAELAARACANADDVLVGQLREVLDHNLRALELGDLNAMENGNWAFHRMINRAAGSPKLLLLLQTTLSFIPHGFYALVADWGEASERGHAQILRAIESRDVESARSASAEHVQEAADLLIKHLSKTAFLDGAEG
jgi:DNA-binding GntR family transcriptional regulator